MIKRLYYRFNDSNSQNATETNPKPKSHLNGFDRVYFIPKKMTIHFPLHFVRNPNGSRLTFGKAWFAHHNKHYSLKHTNCQLFTLPKHENPIDTISPAKRSNVLRKRCKLIVGDEFRAPNAGKNENIATPLTKHMTVRESKHRTEHSKCQFTLSKQLRWVCDKARTTIHSCTLWMTFTIRPCAPAHQTDASIYGQTLPDTNISSRRHRTVCTYEEKKNTKSKINKNTHKQPK